MDKKLIHGFCFCLATFFTCCRGQINTSRMEQHTISASALVGGGCDGCDLMYVDLPSSITPVDSSSAWFEKGQKLLITGKVFKIDGKTPAPNVILYYWHTDHEGYYSSTPKLNKDAKRHGHIRGWVKTNEKGEYAIYTIRPAPYPNDSLPAHIHTAIKEPDIQNEYYIDEFVFDDDKLLTAQKRKALENRGGSGILRVLVSGDLQIAEHNIVLGLNIPKHPSTVTSTITSGLSIGKESPSFIPFHAYGPDKGKRACPVCKYGRYHGIIYFVGDNPEWQDIKKWLAFLEIESIKRKKYLKAYFVYGNKSEFNKINTQRILENVGKELMLENIALTYVPSMDDKECKVNLYQINPKVKNTFIIFRHRTIIDKYIELSATEANLKLISTSLDNTKGDYFNLTEIKKE